LSRRIASADERTPESELRGISTKSKKNNFVRYRLRAGLGFALQITSIQRRGFASSVSEHDEVLF
jgi:hypothetical protein